MSLETGTQLGVYEILSPLGAGGMGEVYRARDSKLQRDVALKILPEAMARDAQRMARFEREARTLASLNHPNIAAIYGLEESDGIRALVMELVEGETLAERIGRSAGSVAPGFSPAHAGLKAGSTRGQGRTPPSTHEPSPQGRGWSGGAGPGEGSRGSALAVDDALPLAKQIAEALEYAHERGVIHRDLKPANVKINPEGTVKVLDFGLAKVLDVQDSSVTMDMANSPTLSTMATQAGMILGTAAYMSPEQAKGQRVDRRADIWAFGCVLYEMLAGQKPFEGETISDVLAAVIKSEPDWTAIPETTPPSIQRLVRRCLHKDQRQRLQAIGEARITIEETLSGSPIITSPLPSVEGGPEERDRARVSPLRHFLPWGVAALFAILLGAAIWAPWRKEAPTPAIVSEIVAPPNNTFTSTGNTGGVPVLSPDGRWLAFVAKDSSGKQFLWVRPLDSGSAKLLPGTQDASYPFWSWDSRNLGFYAQGKLNRIDISGGPPLVLCDAPAGRGGAWNRDGKILFNTTTNSPLYEVPESGGTPKAVTTLDATRSVFSNRWPQFLPDGNHFLFYARSQKPEENGIYVASLAGGKPKMLVRTGMRGIYAAPGYLLYMRGNTLMAQKFDTGKLALVGDPYPIAQNLLTNFVIASAMMTASQSGILAYQNSGGTTGTQQIVWFDRRGKQVGVLGEQNNYLMPKVSPDGKKLAVSIAASNYSTANLWVFDLARGTKSRLTFSSATDGYPSWSPDGKRIAFQSNRDGTSHLYQVASDGSMAVAPLLVDSFSEGEPDWSSDGRYILFVRRKEDSKAHAEIWALPLFGKRKPFPVVQSPFGSSEPALSPDGKWLAYVSREGGITNVYVVPFLHGSGKWQISSDGGHSPRWQHDGKELFYLSSDLGLMSANVSTSGDSFSVGKVHTLFQAHMLGLSTIAGAFDVTADGKKFAVITATHEPSEPLTLVTNWPALLKKP